MSADSPVDVSVVIPVFNRWELTRNCLASLFQDFARAAGKPACEVLVVDDASYDQTPREIEKLACPALRFFRLEKNVGFAKACNHGAREAKGRYVLFLNNDTVVLPRAVAALHRSIESNDAIGVVGARLLYPDYTVQHAGIAVDGDYGCHHVYRGYHAEHPFVLVRRRFQAVTGACLIISRELFSALGGFDERYVNSFEDVDLCLRAREAGRQIVYDPDAVLLHYESMSEGRLLPTNTENSKRFVERWRGRTLPDLEEKRDLFALKLRDGLYARTRELLEGPGSPYRSVPYADWDADPIGRDFRDLTRRLLLCDETLRRTRAEEDAFALRRELDHVRRGISYRLGRALTWLPRKLLRRG